MCPSPGKWQEDGKLELQLKSKANNFAFFSLALDERCDARDTGNCKL